jgi:Uma2 family endonuclease
MSTPTVRLRRWTRDEYEHMVESGIFRPEDHIELLDGEIVEMTPQGTRHGAVYSIVADVLRRAFGKGCYVRAQLPLALEDSSEPEPDIAIVGGTPRDYLDAHPSETLLVVEVSESSLRYDRGRKLRAYARNGVPEYWIVNLVDLRLEVYRSPSGEGFGDVSILTAGDHISPLHAPDAHIAVAELLP